MYTNHPLSIKSWAEDDRPREKMQLKGKASLSNAELLAILLGSGTKTKSAVELGQEILNSVDNSLYQLGKLSNSDLQHFSGVGEAKSVTIMAAMELGRRRKDEKNVNISKIQHSRDAYNMMKPYFVDLEHEEFRIMGLSRANKIIKIELISKGGRSGTIADGKLIFKSLLDMKASACILCHNHPSGNLKPSEADIRLTNNLFDFGKLIDLKVLDHIIITDHGYTSISDQGLLRVEK
ncbi:MAG: DNA repair protein RadC [Brumimicrobium sp.]